MEQMKILQKEILTPRVDKVRPFKQPKEESKAQNQKAPDTQMDVEVEIE
jgi:hypothetical protein